MSLKRENAPMGPLFGEDVALTRIQDGILVSHLDPIIGAVKNMGWLAVHVACNVEYHHAANHLDQRSIYRLQYRHHH